MNKNNIHELALEYAHRFGLGSGSKPHSITDFVDPTTSQSLPYFEEIIPAVMRILKAKRDNHRICIYCDYDTDAVTAGATLYWGLVTKGFDKELITLYTPDRFVEGYGINSEALVAIAKQNDLIISVDCGINSVSEVQNVINEGIDCDVIITDHHKIQNTLPNAYAIINPQTALYKNLMMARNEANKKVWSDEADYDRIISYIKKGDYASEYITGVGVAWFVLVWLSYIEKEYFGADSNVSSLLYVIGYVAIGTVADCQSMLDPTNRVLVKYGMKMLQKGEYYGSGLKELMKQTGLISKIEQGYVISSQDLGFVLSPILNASGRLTHAFHSLALLTSDGQRVPLLRLKGEDTSFDTTIEELASDLIQINEDRKKQVSNSLKEVDSQVQAQIEQNTSMIWVEGEWNKGIIGLIASRIVTLVNKPVAVLSLYDAIKEHTTEKKNTISGSLRAPKGYDLALALSECRELLIAGGGHPGASGITIEQSQVSEFKARFSSILEKQYDRLSTNTSDTWSDMSRQSSSIPMDILTSIRNYDSIIILNEEAELEELASSIFALEPFGQFFPFPSILTQLTCNQLKRIGKDKNHIKMNNNGLSITYFFASEELIRFVSKADLSEFVEVIVLLKPSYNSWNGSTKLEFIAQSVWIESEEGLVA